MDTDETEDEGDGSIFGLTVWSKPLQPKSLNESRLAQLTVLARPVREGSQNPNQLFHGCCVERGLPSACLPLCHFNTYNSDLVCYFAALARQEGAL